jgi:hypothetical protein
MKILGNADWLQPEKKDTMQALQGLFGDNNFAQLVTFEIS